MSGRRWRPSELFLNKLEGHYWGSEVHYPMVLTNGGGDAACLVHYLSKGLKAERARDARLQVGAPLPEDLAPGEKV
jgi:hypothetical protein